MADPPPPDAPLLPCCFQCVSGGTSATCINPSCACHRRTPLPPAPEPCHDGRCYDADKHFEAGECVHSAMSRVRRAEAALAVERERATQAAMMVNCMSGDEQPCVSREMTLGYCGHHLDEVLDAALERAEKAEAEVERFNALLRLVAEQWPQPPPWDPPTEEGMRGYFAALAAPVPEQCCWLCEGPEGLNRATTEGCTVPECACHHPGAPGPSPPREGPKEEP